MSKTTILTEFAFAEVHHVLAHFSFFLLFNVVVEFVPLLEIGESFFVFFPGGLAVFVSGWRGLVTRTMVG